MALIGLMSDFGLRDSYVAQMKGIILSICPSATIVDISHGIGKYNVQEGMFLLASAVSCFPAGTIYLAVVDPGVGGSRRPLLLETRRGKFVGPDNGLLTLAAEIDGDVRAYHLTESQYFAERVSSTFHGRDIFAHVVAHLANGVSPSLLGHPISDYVRAKVPAPKLRDGEIHGVVLHIDGFGNVVTNIGSQLLEQARLKFGGRLKLRTRDVIREIPLCRTYSDVNLGEFLATIGGHGFLEFAVNRGDAATLMGLQVGNPIILQRVGLSV